MTVRTVTCPHVTAIRPVRPHTTAGCEDCLRIGSTWLHLRLCLTCGHVGCCDSSPNRHARRHAHVDGHPIVRSFEPGEDWRWCYIDEVFV
jgi:uncharacterized UBP type Zn finger protein